MDFLTTITLLCFGWAATISGVVVGGFLVFKASGNAGGLLNLNKGGAYNYDDEYTEAEPEAPDSILKMNERFRKTFDPGNEMFGSGGVPGVGSPYGQQGATRPWEPPQPPTHPASAQQQGDEDEQ